MAVANCALAVAYLIARLIRCCVLTLFYLARVALLLLLAIFEPFVSLILSGLTLLGVLTAITLEASAIGQTFPFWGMMALSLGCTVLLSAYYGLMRILSG